MSRNNTSVLKGAGCAVVCLLVSRLSLADMSAMVSASEALQERGQGFSRATILNNAGIGQGDVSLSDFTMLSSPPLSGDSPAPSPDSPRRKNKPAGTPAAPPPQRGYSMRHVLASGYRLDERMTIGPVFTLMEPLTGDRSGTLTFSDPQLRLTVAEVVNTNIGENHLRAKGVFGYYAPTSKVSQDSHTISSVSASIVPQLRFAGSRFSLSGIALAKLVGIDRPNGIMTPVRLSAGLQQNYQISRRFTAFVMDHVNSGVGPKVPTEDTGQAMDSYASNRESHFNGLMVGLNIHAGDGISVSPRANWFTDQSIGQSTVGLNANFQLL